MNQKQVDTSMPPTETPVAEAPKKIETPIPTSMAPQELLTYVKGLQGQRSRFEPSWYRAFHAYENNCFVAWSRVTQSIIKIPYKKRFFVSLPEVKRQCDAFENNLLQFMPMFVVYPDDIGDVKARDDSRYLSKLLKKHYIDWDSKNLVHKFLHNAIKYPISFWEIGVENRINPLTSKMQKVIVPSVGDAFDYLFDPHIPFNDNPIIAKKIKRNLKDIKEYKDYKAPTISGGFPDDMKEMIFNDKYGIRGGVGDMKTQFLYQVMEKLKDGIKETIMDTSGNVLRTKFYEGATEYPVVPLSLFSNDDYSPSFCENLIPINRSINLIVNRIEEFIMKFAKGAFLVRDGSDIMFSDENGVIVKYEGEPPTAMDMPQLPNAIIMWLNKLLELSERYGLNAIAMGLTAKGSQNRTVGQGEQAQQGANVQQKTPLDNMVQAFTRIANITIYYLSEFTDEPTSFSFRSQGDDFSARKFIGEKWANKDRNAVKIPHNIKSMEVEIEDVSASSIYAKRADLLAIAKEWGAIPAPFQEVLLDLYKVGNTADIMAALEKNKTLLDNPEFKAIIEQMRAGNVDPATKQAFSVFMDWLSQQSPTPGVEDMGVKSNVPNTPDAGTPTPPENDPVAIKKLMASMIDEPKVENKKPSSKVSKKPAKKVSFKNRKK